MHLFNHACCFVSQYHRNTIAYPSAVYLFGRVDRSASNCHWNSVISSIGCSIATGGYGIDVPISAGHHAGYCIDVSMSAGHLAGYGIDVALSAGHLVG